MKMENNNKTTQVLVIDDEQDLRDGAERILTRLGCPVFKAPRGDIGLEIINKEDVAIVLLDMKMPGMDGMEVLKRIMDIDNSILVIVITGYATLETAIEAMKIGAYDFISKPYEPEQLRIVIRRAREKLELKWEAEKLEKERKETLLDLDAEKSRIRTIIESLPNGIMVTNSNGMVALLNPSLLQHLQLDPGLTAGEPVGDYLQDKELCDLILKISKGEYIDSNDIPTYELAMPDNKYLMARVRPIFGEQRECIGAVVNFVDISTMKTLEHLKSEFVAKVSHELRSPLSTIHEQLAQVLKDFGSEGSEDDQYMLSRAKEKTNGLISLIGDLLDLSRIESGMLAQEVTDVNLDDLLKNIVNFLNTRADNKQQSLTMEAPAEPVPTLKADPVALESLFGNLISNAINYTQEGGTINVKIEDIGTDLKVTVSDNGFGIDEKYLDKIFDRFYRVKNDKTRYITGTGLGLPIVKSIVDELKGSISVKSKPGFGTTFSVLLPIT
jgi:signal transduction histidine kinase